MTTWDIVCADVNEWAEKYDGPPFHAVLCDAPYEMREVDIDNLGAQGKGFMGKDWDGSGVSFDPDTWRGIARHLLPGAFLFVFAGTINDDLISLAMRRAGLRKHHKAAFYHAQGQGFPKSTRIDTQVDEAAGAKREIIGQYDTRSLYDGAKRGKQKRYSEICYAQDSYSQEWTTKTQVTAPATPLAKTWAGHRYGLQSLKPSVESILIFQKPYAGKSVDSIVETGAGALWIEGGRINLAYWDQKSEGGRTGLSQGSDGLIYEKGCGGGGNNNRSGRWPANLLLAHIAPSTCPDCDGDGCDTCDGEGLVGGCRRVGEKRVSVPRGKHAIASGKGSKSAFDGGKDRPPLGYVNDDGYETVADWQCVDGWLLTLPEPCPYCGTKQDFKFKLRSGIVPWGTVVDFDSYEVKCQGCQEQYDFELERVQCPVKALGEQSGERPGNSRPRTNSGQDNVCYGDFQTCITQNDAWGDQGTCARYFHQSDWTAERIEHAAPVHYQAKAGRRERNIGLSDFYWRKDKTAEIGFVRISREEWERLPKKQRTRGNIHSTVKPVALSHYLACLLASPPAYAPRRLLVPFLGSGSEALGALLSGQWEHITGIEICSDYCDIAEARLAWWADWLAYTGVDDPKELLRLSNNDKVRKEKEAARLV